MYDGPINKVHETGIFRDLIKKPWAFIRVPYMNPTIWVVVGPGFLNQVPTLRPSS